jgi:C4-dicarboxylate-specific signal transduction histidine kinase
MLSSDDKNSLNHRLIELKKRLEVLISEHSDLRTSNEELKGEIRRLRNLSDIQKNTIKDLEEKNKLSKIASVIVSETDDSKLLKLKINEYLRDIDKCIKMLNE